MVSHPFTCLWLYKKFWQNPSVGFSSVLRCDVSNSLLAIFHGPFLDIRQVAKRFTWSSLATVGLSLCLTTTSINAHCLNILEWHLFTTKDCKLWIHVFSALVGIVWVQGQLHLILMTMKNNSTYGHGSAFKYRDKMGTKCMSICWKNEVTNTHE